MYVGGVNVKDYDLEALRNKVAMVLQKNVLFSGTIKENLRWGKEDATDDEMLRVCKLACADDFIQSFPDKYDTYIEQGGTNVSGGQKQRLCIARALLKDPKVLILDDSTCAVDTKTDAMIRRSFREEIPNVTKIIIAQRVSSVQDADQIIVMDGGKIDAIGTHEELLASNAIYQEVYYSQNKIGNAARRMPPKEVPPMRKATMPRRKRPKMHSFRLLGRLLSYLFHYYKGRLIAVFICIAVTAAAGISSSVFLQLVIAQVITPLTEGARRGRTSPATLFWIIGGMGAMYVVALAPPSSTTRRWQSSRRAFCATSETICSPRCSRCPSAISIRTPTATSCPSTPTIPTRCASSSP